jgi:hypothetical protein
VEELPIQPRLARNRFRSGTQSDPCISSVTTSIMITTSNSPVKGSGTPYQFLGVLVHTMAMSGLSRVRTEFFQLLVIPSLAPHPVQTNRESPRHGYFGDLSSPPQRQVTYRSWLDSVGTSMGVQQKLMRHAQIATTMNVYGNSMMESKREANRKVVRMALEPTIGSENERAAEAAL